MAYLSQKPWDESVRGKGNLGHQRLCATEPTKSNKYIKCLEPDLTSRVFAFVFYINATSTPEQKNRTGTHKPAATCIRVQRKAARSYDRARFGRRSEKLGSAGAGADEEAQQAFVFEEIETGIGALKVRLRYLTPTLWQRDTRPRKRPML